MSRNHVSASGLEVTNYTIPYVVEQTSRGERTYDISAGC